MLGVVKQELLSGIKHDNQFDRICDILNGFPCLLATEADHVLAAQFYNECRGRGIQGSHIDFLICAQAVNAHAPILTADGDFEQYATAVPIDLLKAE